MVLGQTCQPISYQAHANTHIPEAAVTHSDVRMPATSESGSVSDHSETSSSSDDKGSEMKADDICRDYLRNVCKRGKRCKYRHPDPNEAKELGRRQEYTFCHDYQNSGCRRHNCRFLHCTRDEEDYHKQTGQLPVRLQQAAALGIGVVPNELPLLKGEVPVCKDFLKGQCMRGGRCKYRHVAPPQFPESETPPKEGNPRNGSTETFENDEFERYSHDFDSTTTPTMVTIATKRRRTEDSFSSSLAGFHRTTTTTPVDYTWLLEEENTILRRKVEELKKHVSDLAATNEVLLEQNARYRSNKCSTAGAAQPIITVSQVVTPAITPTPVIARTAIAHHAQTIATLTGQAHLTLNSNSAHHAHPQNMAAIAGPKQLTVNGNSELIMSQPTVAQLNNTAVSVALNSVTQNMVPVSIMDHSLQTQMPSVTMAQNMGQAVATPSSLTQSVPPSAQTLCIGSNLNTQLVSYPIMSQCVSLPNTSLG